MEFPDLGKHCSENTCNKLDFLPMECDSCQQIFCNDHFSYLHHGCDGARKKDVQVPACPLCGVPVPGKRGEAPDIAVSEHIDNDCQADPAKQRRNKVYTNRCALKGCKGKEMVSLVCPECSLNFCFKHRHATDHQCEGKLGAKRRKAAEAAATRLKAKEAPSGHKSHNGGTPADLSSSSRPSTFSEVQGNMSEDEALARALSLSMQDEANPISQPPGSSHQGNPSLLRNQNNRQRVGGEQSNSKCTLS